MARVDAVPVAVGRLRHHALRPHLADHAARCRGAGRASTRPGRRDSRGSAGRARRRPRRPRSAPRGARPAISSRGMPVSAPPASPSVTMQYVTSIPASVSWATEPAKPKSTSSGCAVTTSTRSTPVRSPARPGRPCARRYRRDRVAVRRPGAGRAARRRRPPRASFAALVLGAATIEAVQTDTGLDARAAGEACSASSTPGSSSAATTAPCTCSARRSRSRPAPRPSARPGPPSTTTSPRTSPASCASFVRDGRLTSIPTVRSKRLVVLDWLAQRFEPGRRYPEQTVNLIICRGASRHRRAPPLPRRRGHPRSGARRVLARRAARSTRSSTRRYGARHVTGSRRSQRPPARERDHAQQARTPELDVVPVGRGVVRGARRGRSRQRHVGRGDDRRRAGRSAPVSTSTTGASRRTRRTSASPGSRCVRCRT